MKVLIADLDGDGQIADSSKREQLARAEAKHLPENSDAWKAALYVALFNPDLVRLDTVQDGAIESLLELYQAMYEIMILSSRPDAMNRATIEWLYTHAVPYRDIILKPRGAQFVRTATWKATEINRINALYTLIFAPLAREQGESIEEPEILYVDDSKANREAVAKLGKANITIVSSLHEAVQMVKEASHG